MSLEGIVDVLKLLVEVELLSEKKTPKWSCRFMFKCHTHIVPTQKCSDGQ